MLDGFIIEELRRREREKKEHQRRERPRLQLPVHNEIPHEKPDEEESDRGPVVIDI